MGRRQLRRRGPGRPDGWVGESPVVDGEVAVTESLQIAASLLAGVTAAAGAPLASAMMTA
jgi:hypothetical protein